MKAICAFSGLELTISYFSGMVNGRICCHPLFLIPQEELFSYWDNWAAGELNKTDSYLLYLALLNSTNLVEFRTSATLKDATQEAFIASHFERLFKIVSILNAVSSPNFQPPSVVLNHLNSDLSETDGWLDAWENYFHDYKFGLLENLEAEKMKKREASLQALIKDQNKPISHYAKILADWAATAGNFPSFLVPWENAMIPISQYWKNIIVACTKQENIFKFPKNDLLELCTHCEVEIPHGSIYASTLMNLLRAGIEKQEQYMQGHLGLSSTTYQIISAEATKEDAVKMAMIQSAPEEKPVLSAYPSKIAFLRADAAYRMAQEYKNAMNSSSDSSDSGMIPPNLNL